MNSFETSDVLMRRNPGGTTTSLNLEARRSPKLSHLEFLPDEILITIIEFAITPKNKICDCAPSQNGRNRAGLEIALCSRRMYQVAEPFIYHHFGETTGRTLQLFLSRLLGNPELQKHVHVVHTEGDVPGPAVSLIQDGDWKQLRTAVYKFSDSEEEAAEWIDNMRDGGYDSFIALLLCITPNIEEIRLDNWSLVEWKSLPEVLSRAATHQQQSVESLVSLAKLNNVSIATEIDEMALEDIEPFLKINSVKTLKVTGLHYYDSETFNPDPATWNLQRYNNLPQYHLRSLELHRGFAHSIGLVRILRQLPFLEKLVYSHQWNSEFAPPLLMEGLKPLQHCLQELSISYIDNGDDYLLKEGPWFLPMGSLVGFKRLRSIDMTASLLIGTNKTGIWQEDSVNKFLSSKQDLGLSLPPGLECLRVSDHDRQLIPHIINLVANKTSYTPSLKSISLNKLEVGYAYVDLDHDSNHLGFTMHEARELSSASKAANIQLSTSEMKSIKYYVNDQRIVVYFPFPYDDFEVWCEEHGCEIETGEPAKFDREIWKRTPEYKATSIVIETGRWPGIPSALQSQELANGYITSALTPEYLLVWTGHCMMIWCTLSD